LKPVSKFFKYPAGFVAGAVAMVYGAATLVMESIDPAVLCILSCALLVLADAITNSLGLLF
jgi:hypothetical protein